MKPLVIAVVLGLTLSACATGEFRDNRLLGRYVPPALDAGISVTLLERGVFLAEWWAQGQKPEKTLSGWVGGRWNRKGDRLILRYATKEKEESEARFDVRESATGIVLKLVSAGEFPFVSFFGDEYPKEEKPNQALQPTRTSSPRG